MHVLPRVRELEERFADTLVGIGVHAGKFSAERVTANIAAAADRLGVDHAIVNDRQFRIWREYGVQAWPTIALVDPRGRLIGVQPGEFPVDSVAEVIENAIADAEAHGDLVRGPDPIARPQTHSSGPVLRYPGRVLALDGRLIVSDTGNGRVLDTRIDPEGDHAQIVATHEGFVEPWGVTVVDDSLYVADRRAHSVWRIDPDGTRTRVAGTGRLGQTSIQPGPATSIDLRSPWGLTSDGAGGLLITMAGSHQLWRLDLGTGHLDLAAGRGGEDLVDGDARSALLAQPTGISVSGDRALFADSESSAVRVLDLADGHVGTIEGTGLFDFGDRDGQGDRALMQHVEDVAWYDGAVAAADTYNDRVKRLDPVTRDVRPWPGDVGALGVLAEPAGIDSSGSHLYVADTNNHRVLMTEKDGTAREVQFA